VHLPRVLLAASVSLALAACAQDDAPAATPTRSDRVLGFGTPYDEALPALTSALGAPTKDTGPIDPFSDYSTCPGRTLQILEYGDGALQLLFGDVEADEPVLYQWALTGTGDPSALPQATALVGDGATLALGPGTTVGELEGSAGEAFQVVEDAFSMDPAFRLQDQSGGFSGFLSGTTPADVVTLVQAGTPCGE
jgi:hypothetical protein